MTLSLLAKVRFLRRENEVSTLWTEELTLSLIPVPERNLLTLAPSRNLEIHI